jgi:hypothetical protein
MPTLLSAIEQGDLITVLIVLAIIALVLLTLRGRIR